MLTFNDPITEIITRRFSCRVYRDEPIEAQKREQLQEFIHALPFGPFGTRPRFRLLAAMESDTKALRGLGTYGFIRNPAAFIVGAMSPSDYGLEDFGYLMEAIILYATHLGLGTCWLGGTFTKSRFAKKIQLSENETIPAVTSVGEFAVTGQSRKGLASRAAGSFKRLPWQQLISKERLGNPLTMQDSGNYATALEMVRLAPSASNKQPWRIVSHNGFWRFYLQRTPGYQQGLIKNLLDLCDLQRLDMGIAMCHFELAALELGMKGQWRVEENLNPQPDPLTEYLVSWQDQTGGSSIDLQ